MSLGSGLDYRFKYDSSNTQFEFETTDSDGIGTNKDLIIIDDGTDDIFFDADVEVSGDVIIDQDSSTEAKPVLVVEQADVSEEFIKFIGESTTDDSQSLIDAVDMTTSGNLTGWIKIYIEDVQATNPIADGYYYVPFYTAPTA